MLRSLLLLPRARRWMRHTIAASQSRSRPIADLGLTRIVREVPTALLQATRVAEVARVPQPPLARWGVESTGLLAGDAAAITLDRLILVRQGLAGDQSLLFHELVHVIQWRMLGINRFLALYGLLLIEHGYRDNPLETMAYLAQRRFDGGETASGIEAIIERRTDELLTQFRRRTVRHRLAFMFVR